MYQRFSRHKSAIRLCYYTPRFTTGDGPSPWGFHSVLLDQFLWHKLLSRFSVPHVLSLRLASKTQPCSTSFTACHEWRPSAENGLQWQGIGTGAITKVQSIEIWTFRC